MPDVPHILLVEDNPAYARLTELTLDEGFAGAVRVTHVQTMGDALRTLADEDAARPDVLVVDLGLPDAQGIQVIVQLHAAGAPPVVVLSGLEGDGLWASLKDAGAAAHVLKGREYEDLAAAITSAIAGGEADGRPGQGPATSWR